MKTILSRWIPLQWVFAVYALLTAFIALYFSTAEDVFNVHIVPRLFLLGWLVIIPLIRNLIPKRIFDFINLALPIAILGSFYYETQFLNQFLISYRDPFLVAVEQWAFGFQPSLAFCQRFPDYWMVELMSMAYFSYYFLTFGLCIYLFLNQSKHLGRIVFIVVTSFILFYSVFIVFPAAGPQFYFPAHQTGLPAGGFFQWAVRKVQSLGEGPTAAFPSSHVAMSLIIIWLSYKHARPLFFIFLPLSVLLIFSTVYIKAHYVVDILAAFIAAPLVYNGAGFLWKNLEFLGQSSDSYRDEVVVREVKTREELRDFIHLPLKLHRNHKSWTPPLVIDEYNVFNPKKNPASEHCSTIRFIAYRGEHAVGRIVGIIHHDYNQKNGENMARFSFLEIPDDYELFKSLMGSVEQWARNNGCQSIVGPFGFSDKDPQGFVVEGHEASAMMFTNGNFPYLPEMMMSYGFREFTRLVQYKFPVNEVILGQLTPFSRRALANGRLQVIDFTSTREVRPYVRSVFELINQTYSSIYGFSQVTQKEADDFANRFLPLLNPRLIKMVLNDKEELVAFIVAMPNLAPALKKSGGKLLPLGWFHLLKANRNSRELVLLLGGVRESERNHGLDAILGASLIQSAIELGFENIDSHLILEDNYKMRHEIERLRGYILYKKYCIYTKTL